MTRIFNNININQKIFTRTCSIKKYLFIGQWFSRDKRSINGFWLVMIGVRNLEIY